MSQKVYYNGIFGENHIKLVREIINIVSLDEMFSRIGYSVKTHAHRNLFQIFVLEKGKVELLANNEHFAVDQPSIITIPQSVFHGLEFEPGSKGYLISLSANAVEQMLKFDVEVIYELDTISITKISQKNQLVEDVYNTIHKCVFEYNNALPGKDLALQYLVGMLLLRLYRINHSNQTVIHTLNQNERTVFRNFKKLVQENNSIKKRVEDYSSELGITVAALSQICKAISGKSPKEVILDFLILNIKSTLKNPEFSISEVSYQFDIDDPSYFARLFKQKTGQTPKQYRSNLN
ncbi:AraC family transcriptional regulator [Kaistella faecalis]|uniref:AraC family transcriptional regulator n=1 Tax=Kaistella faecalis TaxID=2852098 RepID=UPI001C45662E|nr:AraC family transcriptional regulator [Chryseobacterium faecale]UFK98193.1 AraC family transcriptional regulator [Chryseobacterium faecale]